MLSPCEEISGDYCKNAAPEVGSPTLSRGMVGPPQPPQIAKIKASGFLRQMRDATTAWSGYYTAVMTYVGQKITLRLHANVLANSVFPK